MDFLLAASTFGSGCGFSLTSRQTGQKHLAGLAAERMNRHDAGISPQMRGLAQRLLSYEAAVGRSSKTDIPVACRVFEELRHPLCMLVGVQGCRVLLARALTLATSNVPSLSVVTVQSDGSLAGLSDINAGELLRAGVVLTAHLLGLLSTFIGEGLTLQILLGVWPGLPYTRDSGESEHDSTQ